MALGQKVFETLFRINAKWQGQHAVAQAKGAIKGVAVTAQTAALRVKGMTAAVFKGQAAYDLMTRAIGGAVQVVQKSIDAAYNAQVAQEELSLSVARTASSYKENLGKSGAQVQQWVDENVRALGKMAEEMAKTGQDAEALKLGFSNILKSKALSTTELANMRKMFSDSLSYVHRAGASEEQAAQHGEAWSDFINQGNMELLKALDATSAELNLNRAINRELRKGNITFEQARTRRLELLKAMAGGPRIAKETERAYSGTRGQWALMLQHVEDALEKLGEPFVARATEVAKSIDKISAALDPVVRKMADITDNRLKTLADWLTANQSPTITFLTEAFTWLQRIDNLKFDTIKWLLSIWKISDAREWWKMINSGEPTRMAQLPGAPAQAPGYGAAGTMGEAHKRNINAQIQSGVRAAEEKTFTYGEGYPSAMPGKVLPPGAKPTAAAGGPVNEALVSQVKKLEGYYPKAYWDYKQWSIGHGTRARAGQTTTREQAEKDLVAELATHQRNVDRAAAAVGLKLTAGQRDALTSFDFNTGAASRVILSSGGSIENIARRIPLYNKAGGRLNQGLINRRAAEMQMFNAPSLKDATSSLSPRAAAGGSTQNISMSSPITVNGVAPGREYAVGRTVRNAMREPMREFLDRIKAARSYESRLGYV
jgi:lysozyme